jgi:chromosomal replication initiator protein
MMGADDRAHLDTIAPLALRLERRHRDNSDSRHAARTTSGMVAGGLLVTLNPRYTFANFVIGASNDEAAAAASAVAAAPGSVYNPLFIYGETGLGKTHLMQAVAHEVAARRMPRRVAYECADEFLSECVRAIAQGDIDRFRARHATTHLLLIDDVHALASRPEAQAELATVFRHITARGGQVMLTSDRPPGDTGIDAALARRFALGRVARIAAPAWEHRLAILQSKVAADALGDVIPREVLEFIATNITSNVRASEGAITRLLAYARLRGEPITIDSARRVFHLGVDARSRETDVTRDPTGAAVQLIVSAVAREWDTTPEALHGARRTRDIARPRQVAMHLCRDLLELPLADIGQRFGGRDHTTVMYAIERVTAMIVENEDVSRRHHSLRSALRPLIASALHSAPPGDATF